MSRAESPITTKPLSPTTTEPLELSLEDKEQEIRNYNALLLTNLIKCEAFICAVNENINSLPIEMQLFPQTLISIRNLVRQLLKDNNNLKRPYIEIIDAIGDDTTQTKHAEILLKLDKLQTLLDDHDRNFQVVLATYKTHKGFICAPFAEPHIFIAFINSDITIKTAYTELNDQLKKLLLEKDLIDAYVHAVYDELSLYTNDTDALKDFLHADIEVTQFLYQISETLITFSKQYEKYKSPTRFLKSFFSPHTHMNFLCQLFHPEQQTKLKEDSETELKHQQESKQQLGSIKLVKTTSSTNTEKSRERGTAHQPIRKKVTIIERFKTGYFSHYLEMQTLLTSSATMKSKYDNLIAYFDLNPSAAKYWNDQKSDLALLISLEEQQVSLQQFYQHHTPSVFKTPRIDPAIPNSLHNSDPSSSDASQSEEIYSFSSVIF